MTRRQASGIPVREPKILETPRLKAVLDALQTHPRVRYAARQNRGAARFRDDHGRERWVSFGVDGASDIEGMLKTGGKLAVEVKQPGEWRTEETFQKYLLRNAGRGKPLSEHQRRLLHQWLYLAMVDDTEHGIGFVAYGPEQVWARLGEPAGLQQALPGIGDRRHLVTGERRHGRSGSRWGYLPARLEGRAHVQGGGGEDSEA